jgi:hypothetical protein
MDHFFFISNANKTKYFYQLNIELKEELHLSEEFVKNNLEFSFYNKSSHAKGAATTVIDVQIASLTLSEAYYTKTAFVQ